MNKNEHIIIINLILYIYRLSLRYNGLLTVTLTDESSHLSEIEG